MTSSSTALDLKVPHPELTVLPPGTVPDAAYLRTIQRELYANCSAVPSALGGGNHGHLGLIMPAAEYANLSNVAFAVPACPAQPVYAGVQLAQRNQAETYATQLRNYDACTAVISLIKQQILQAVPHEYLAPLNDALLGFSQATPAQLLAHLRNTYGAITTDDLEANFSRLSTPWDPTTPIETIFTNVRDCMSFANDGGDPISDAQAMREVLKTIEASGVLDKAVEDWRLQAAAARTFANLLPFFCPRNQERLCIQALKGNKYSANKASSNDPSKQLMDILAYCWTHGASTNVEHTSATCSNPAPGHDKSATITDMKGGNNTIRRKPGERSIYVKPPRKDRSNRTSNAANTAAAAPAPAPTPAPAPASALRPSTYTEAANGMAQPSQI